MLSCRGVMQIAQPPIPRLRPARDLRADDWARLQEPLAAPLYQSILECIPIHGRCLLLDVGCGSGLFCEMACRVGATPTGLDLSPALIGIARQRECAGRFAIGDMLSLPYDDASFHVVTAIDSVQRASQLLPVMSEARRVSRPGGAVVVATLGPASGCEALAYLRALSALAGDRAGAFIHSEDGTLERVATDAGLAPVLVEDVECTWSWPDLETAQRSLMAGGVAALAIELAGETAVSEAIAEALRPFRAASGSFALRNRYRYVIAVTPTNGPDAA